MMHDDKCEDTFAELACNCHVRALEAKLAALRPLVRAAVLVHEPNLQHEGTWMTLPACVGRDTEHMVRVEDVQSVELEVRALDPDLIAWAKGGE